MKAKKLDGKTDLEPYIVLLNTVYSNVDDSIQI
jgi:hypothetical protein